jgi:hypothetical protein
VGLSGPFTVPGVLSHAEYPLFETLTFARDDVRKYGTIGNCLFKSRLVTQNVIVNYEWNEVIDC